MKVKNIINKLPKHKYKKYSNRPINAITSIAVHHSLTDEGTPEAFANYHVNNLDWPGIAYHYVIDKEGIVYITNEITTKSYHVGNHNYYTLGICLVGDFRDSQPTKEQYNALMYLLKIVSAFLGIKEIKGHSEYEGYSWKICPSIDMNKVRDDWRGK